MYLNSHRLSPPKELETQVLIKWPDNSFWQIDKDIAVLVFRITISNALLFHEQRTTASRLVQFTSAVLQYVNRQESKLFSQKFKFFLSKYIFKYSRMSLRKYYRLTSTFIRLSWNYFGVRMTLNITHPPMWTYGKSPKVALYR